MFETCPIYLKGITGNCSLKAVLKFLQPWSTDRNDSTNQCDLAFPKIQVKLINALLLILKRSYAVHLLRIVVMYF